MVKAGHLEQKYILANNKKYIIICLFIQRIVGVQHILIPPKEVEEGFTQKVFWGGWDTVSTVPNTMWKMHT